MTDDKLKNPYYWIRTLGSAMWSFQCQPTEQRRAALLEALKDYQTAASQGVSLGRAIPPPTCASRYPIGLLQAGTQRGIDTVQGAA